MISHYVLVVDKCYIGVGSAVISSALILLFFGRPRGFLVKEVKQESLGSTFNSSDAISIM